MSHEGEGKGRDGSGIAFENWLEFAMTEELRQKIYELLKARVLPIVRYDNDLMNVLSAIWNVYQQKSTGDDYRYKVLGDEIEKHYIMNDDWVDDKLFIRVLNIFEDEAKFIRLTEQLLRMIQSDDGFLIVASELSKLLAEENLILNNVKDEQGYSVFRIEKKGSPSRVIRNARKFYVCDSHVYNAVSFYEDDIRWPSDNDCLVLTYDYLWNDYSYKTRYRLYYWKDGKETEIGQVKIMKGEKPDTSEHLPKEFLSLEKDYCSLGCSPQYYRNLRHVFGEEALIILDQLRDAAFYESIYKQFERNGVFKTSLIRDNTSEKARREGRYIVYGRDLEEAYSFSYRYHLPYKGEDVEIDFNYRPSGQDYERIIGMIGENGVGKTTLIKKILHSLINNVNKDFTRVRPLFSSVLIISYSPFDHYPIGSDANPFFINYEYSGLMKDKDVMYTTEEQVEILIRNIKIIYHRQQKYYTRWQTFVSKVIPIEKLEELLAPNDNEIDVDEKGLLDLCENASSGETMFLYSISAIMAKIRSDSLIIMDEPEQHLHPSAVTALMHSVYKILTLYDSYALISTHSPYVIRELISPNVLIFKRNENELSVKRIGIESFGEDVSVLSDIVFGNISEEKRYERFIEDVVKANDYEYEASVSALQKGPNTLSLNAKLLVRTIISRKQNETS